MYALPFLVYFFLTLLVLDAGRLGLRLIGGISLSRVFLAGETAIAIGLAVLAVVYGTFHARDIRTAHYEIALNKPSPGGGGQKADLRIALISDLHIGATVDRKWIARVVDAVNRTKPDVICIAGDIFDNDFAIVRDHDGVGAELGRLKAPLGVYACPGNHDVDRLSLSTLREGAALDRIQDFLKNSGVTLLMDKAELIDGRFYLIGRKDARPIGLKQERESAAGLCAGLDRSKPLIFLDHQPVDYPNEEKAGADLILSGHTHRGQFFPGNIITSWVYKKAGSTSYGYWQGSSAQGVVSSGAGVWGPPIRIATDSEAVVVDISFKN
ncbi:MAG: metallophosphoesterase [Treponema sp.]|nr:metallophosphoesterase [Treponema sp.]